MRGKSYLTSLLVAACLFVFVACGGSGTTGEDTSGQMTKATINVDFTSGAHKAGPRFAAVVIGTVNDIRSITVDASSTSGYIIQNMPLTNNGGTWTATISDLPVGEQLTFTGHAYNNASEEIFTGTTTQTLTGADDLVAITMAPAMNDGTLQFLRITRISRPAQIMAGSTAPVSISILGNAGETLTYEITPAADGGTFSPISGNITLTGSSLTIVMLYTAPNAPGTHTHSVRVVNQFGNATETTFDTNVASQLASSNIIAQFNPVVTAVTAVRSGNDVTFTAFVDASGGPSDLRYQWSYSPSCWLICGNQVFADAAVNPAVLLGYEESLPATLTLVVTNSAGGSTTVTYRIAQKQFPVSVVSNLLLLPHSAVWTGIDDCRFGAVSGNIVTLAMEEFRGNDYNNDGDYQDRILGYIDISTNTLVNTGIAVTDSGIAIFGDTMAFVHAGTRTIGWYSISTQTSHDTGIVPDDRTFGRDYQGPTRVLSNGRLAYMATVRDLDGDGIDDRELHLYQMATAVTTPTGVMVGKDDWIDGRYLRPYAYAPSFHGDVVAFVTPQVTIGYYNVTTGEAVDTGIKGSHPTIDNGIIVFDSFSETVAYFDISAQKYVLTPIPVNDNANASISNGIIAAAVREDGNWGDLNGDGEIGTNGSGVLVLYDIATGKMVSTGVRICCGPEISGFVIAFDDDPGCSHWYVVIDDITRQYFGK